jgi:glycosyltransferase involved in cell wall biosynthesis
MKILKHNPTVCICIPTYNSAETILETLKSVLNQTYKKIVINILDNASTDETIKIIKNFKDERIRIYENTQNVGAERNFSNCINEATGEYTVIFHSDDIYEPEMIAEQVYYLNENPKVGAVFTEAITIDAIGNPTGKITLKTISGIERPESAVIYDFQALFSSILKHGNFIVCPSAMVRTVIYKEEIKHWRGELFKTSADLDVWLRIASAHLVAILNKPLIRYRVDDRQFSSKVRKRVQSADFFLVTEYYMEKKNIQNYITDKDKINYKKLLIIDKLWRAINYFQNDNAENARRMAPQLSDIQTLCFRSCTKRDILIALTLMAFHLILFFGLNMIGRLIINNLRLRLNK